MNIKAIDLNSAAVFGDKKKPAVGGEMFSESKKAGRFDTFTLTGTARDKTDKPENTRDAQQTELIHKLSASSGEEQALAAIDSYNSLRREMSGRIRSLEETIEHFTKCQQEYDFCKKSLESGKAAYSGEFSFGRYEAGADINEEALKFNMGQLERGINIYVNAFNRDSGQSGINKRIVASENRLLADMIDTYNAATGSSGAGDKASLEHGGCFDRYIDGVTADNFVSKLRDKISQLQSSQENLTKSFKTYINGNKLAQGVLKNYPKILSMRKEFQGMHEKFHDLEKRIKDGSGINDLLDEIEAAREKREKDEDKLNFDGIRRNI